MAKRRLSRQQQKRIQNAQHADSDSADFEHGRVVSHQGGQVLVELDSGVSIDCKIKSNLGNLVCGDRVAVEKTTQEQHRVNAILPRENLLQRVDGFGHLRSVAANISQLFVCLAVTPEPNLFLLDQYLLSAEQQKIDVCILLNKIDLWEGDEDPFQLRRIYAPAGYSLVSCSAKTSEGMDEFKRRLPEQVSVLSGVSGVGKSSLSSYLLPGEEIKIASMSEANEEGRHTTRVSRLYHLPDGGDLIDTPGVRGFSPFIASDRPLAHGFREIQNLAGECRFHNCLHSNEPKCAVIAAVQAGEVATSRYQNYLKMLQQGGGS